MFNFRLGNCLRGYFEGEFIDVDTAWKYLAQRFLLSYPVEEDGGRHVEMLVYKENEYGLEGYQQCKVDIARPIEIDKDEVLSRCKQANL